MKNSGVKDAEIKKYISTKQCSLSYFILSYLFKFTNKSLCIYDNIISKWPGSFTKSVIILMIYILWRNIDFDKYELLQNCCYIVLSDSPSNFYLKDFK